jgi:hypothetical protein
MRKAERTNPTEKVESSGRIKWGEKNLYPQWLVGLAQDNPIHGGILEQKRTFIWGNGIELIGAQAEKVMNNSISSYTLNELLEPVIHDAELFNGYAVLFQKDSFGFWYATPIDFELVRRIEDGIFYEISDDWSSGSQSAEQTNWRQVKCFYKREINDTEVLLYNIQKPKQRIIKEKNKQKVSLSYYPTPTYNGGLTSIQAGLEMDWFTFAEAVNGLKGGTIVNMSNGMPDSQTDAEEKAKKIKGDATDEENQGGVIVTFSDGKERAVEVHQLNGNDLDKRYIEQNKEVAKKIMIAHQVISASLFGVMNESIFGGKEELETVFVMFNGTYVAKRQRFVLEPILYASNQLNGLDTKGSFKPYVLPFMNQPMQQVQMSEDKDPIFEALSKCGVERSNVEIKHSESYDFSRTDDEFISQFSKFAVNLNKQEEAIVQMIKDGKKYNEIASDLEIRGIELSKVLIGLGDKGVLDGWNINEDVIEQPQFKVLYSYEVKAGLGSAVIPTTRDFCKRLVELDRLYSRQEIDTISSAVERDVWRYRGGWYHNPKTDVTTPSCRHEWKQNIIKA